MILGQAAVARQALQSMEAGQRLFLKRHSTASKALAFNQRHPA